MNIPANRLKYTLHSDSAGDRECKPAGESSFKLKFDLYDDADDPRFDYDVSFDGTLVFAGDDYAWIKAIEDSADRCETLTIEMDDTYCEGTPNIFPGTVVKLSEAEYDLDKCIVTIKVSSPDKYECYNTAKDDPLNMFDNYTVVSPYIIDPEITFEFLDTGTIVGTTMSVSAQTFEGFPNKNAEYPGYGIEDEEETGGMVATPATLYNDPMASNTDLVTDVATGNYVIDLGTKPQINVGGYTDPDVAIAEGWRVHAHFYTITRPTFSALKTFSQFFWVRCVKLVPTGTVMGPEWIFVATIGPNDKYAKAPLMSAKDRFVTLEQREVTTSDFGIYYSYAHNNIIGYLANGPQVFGMLNLVNGRQLNDMIVQAVNHCCPDLTVKSDFFQIDPWTVSDDNPVTGDTSTTNNIIVFQKSDVKRPFDTGHATIGMFTPDQLMMILRKQFEIRFRIVDDVFMIEHKDSDLFNHAVVIDLTSDAFNRFLAASRVYSYTKDLLPAKETFAFMEQKELATGTYSDFNGANITYNGNCVNRGKTTGIKAHLIDSVTNDVEWILTEGKVKDKTAESKVSDDGFVFVATKIVPPSMTVLGGNYIISKSPIIGDQERLNNVMGWAFLHDMFFKTSRNAITGEMNNFATTFDSTKYIKLSKKLTFDLCCIADFDPYAFVTWALGTGVFNSIEYSIFNQIMTVDIAFRD